MLYCMILIVFVFTAQASTGKQGVLGPTKIYLAVQPNQTDAGGAATVDAPPPLTPVVQNVQQEIQPQQVCNLNNFKKITA